MELVLLGTGNAQAVRCYNTCFALGGQGAWFLVDAGGGNGIFRQLELAEIPLREIHTVFVTHKHIDHLLGVVWLVRIVAQRMDKGGFTGSLTLYGNSEVISLLHTLCDSLLQKKQTAHIGRDILFCPVQNGETREILGQNVTFFDIGSTKAFQFGFSMRLPNGEKLTCCGDEPYAPSAEEYAGGSDWLLHEAFCLETEADRFHPYEKHHSTVADACKTAEALGVKRLILYHTEDSHLPDRKAPYLAEGAPLFSGELFVPDDLERFTVS